MDRESHLGTLIVVAVAFATVIVPFQTAATHNSIGAGVNVVQADEVVAGADVDQADRGTLVADVPSDPDSPGGPSPGWDASDFDGGDHPYVQRFHENLANDSSDQTTVREAPPDQTGERYHGDCETAKDLEGLSDTEYDEKLRDGTACYIGFYDMQWEYNIVTHTGLHHQKDTFKHSDDLYPLNPAEGDTYCSGEEDTGDRGVTVPDDVPEDGTIEDQANSPIAGEDSAVDEAITHAARADDDECSGANHDQYNTPHNLVIDTDLVERPMMGADADGQDGTGLADAVGTEEGSGTLSLPFLTTFYFYIFGEPHPDNDDPMKANANSGYFGGEIGEAGSPLTDITGACGDRTRECTMLEPFDIKRYDRYDTNDDPLDKARVCFYSPQFQTVNPGGSITGACGAFGSRVHEFVGNATAGGLGVTDNPTHVNNPAGWYANSFFIALAPAFIGVNAGFDLLDDEQGFDDGTFLFSAVNPKEPSKSSSVWCARPNFIGHASDRFTLDNGDTLSDGGFYDYAADAIDTDIFVNPALNPTRTATNTIHDPAREVLGPVQALADDTEGAVDDATQLPANDLVNRTDYIEAEAEDDKHTVENPTDSWAKTRERGLRCDGNGVVSFSEEPTDLNTSVVFDVDVSGQSGGVRTDDTITQVESLGFSVGPCEEARGVEVCTDTTPKDPTLTSDGLPANESNTREGHWTTNAYTFSGRAVGVVDTNTDGDFDACTISTGQPNPARDQCPWTSLWDVYNGACTVPAEDTDCREQAEQWNYSVAEDSFEDHTSTEVGVGLYAVAHVTGPVATVDEEGTNDARNQLIGFDSAAGAQHCIVGVSTGFTPKLATHFGVSDGSGGFNEGDLLNAICEDKNGDLPNGEQVLIEDAFNDQKGANGDYSAAIDIVQFEPTPNALEEELGTGIGAGDEICVNGIWTVRDTADFSADTEDAQQMSGINEYGDCDPLDTGFQ